MTSYASEKHALGICDRCGVTYKLRDLIYEVNAQDVITWRVCASCWDPVNPQDRPIEFEPDAQTLEDPRPDIGAKESREIPGGIIPVEDL